MSIKDTFVCNAELNLDLPGDLEYGKVYPFDGNIPVSYYMEVWDYVGRDEEFLDQIDRVQRVDKNRLCVEFTSNTSGIPDKYDIRKVKGYLMQKGSILPDDYFDKLEEEAKKSMVTIEMREHKYKCWYGLPKEVKEVIENSDNQLVMHTSGNFFERDSKQSFHVGGVYWCKELDEARGKELVDVMCICDGKYVRVMLDYDDFDGTLFDGHTWWDEEDVRAVTKAELQKWMDKATE
jgi:hypothetical protein